MIKNYKTKCLNIDTRPKDGLILYINVRCSFRYMEILMNIVKVYRKEKKDRPTYLNVKNNVSKNDSKSDRVNCFIFVDQIK